MSDKSKKTPNLDTSARHVESADKYDESAKALFDWAGDRDVVEVNVDASRSQVADMLRKAAEDGAKAEREACAVISESQEYANTNAPKYIACLIRARGKGGA